VRSLHFKIFSASFLITLLSPDIATSINMHVPFSLSRIICLACYWGWFCQFALTGSTVWSPCILDLLLQILVHVCTSVFCPVVPLFPCIC
jgi:hypothetical protein